MNIHIHDQKNIKCPRLPIHNSIDQNLHVMYRVNASCLNGSMVWLPFKHKEFVFIMLKWKFTMLPKFMSQGSQVHNQMIGARSYMCCNRSRR